MAFNAKVYKVLIASPSDVSEERELIPKILHEWNTKNSEHYKMVFLPIKWETHTIPTMGKRPQEEINKQIVAPSDILIGTFWTKLGTHTGVAESGTVEEITKFMEQNKKVMLYFSNKPVVPSSIDQKQYKRLQRFMATCQTKGLYATYDSSDSLKEQLTNHLTLFAKENSFATELEIIPTNTLSVGFYHPKNKEITTELNSFNWSHLSKSELIKNKKQALKELAEKISAIKLAPRTEEVTKTEISLSMPILISSEEKEEYNKIYKEIMGTTLDDDFYQFGDIKESIINLSSYLGGSSKYSGTDNEKTKYKLYQKFIYQLKELESFIDYFNYLEEFNVAPLILMNPGEQFNESITVKLILPNDIQILNAQNIEKPDYYCIEAFTDELLDAVFKPKEDSTVLKYYLEDQHSYSRPLNYIAPPLFNNKSFEEELSSLQAAFEEEATEVLFFKTYNETNTQTIKFTFDELNPSTNMWFPCYLLLKSNKTFNIDYEITSKNLPQKINGTLIYKI